MLSVIENGLDVDVTFPLAGEGHGGGQPNGILCVWHPPPQPSPARGEGADRRRAAPCPGYAHMIVAVLTSASNRSRAPGRPASAYSLQVWWYVRSTACDDRDRSAVRR